MSADERWMVISNCQTYGLAHSLQMLAEGVTVDAADIFEYRSNLDHYNSRFGGYDRVLAGLGPLELPGADFSRAPRVDKVPELVFSAYHPDLTYIRHGEDVVSGPLGAYHSMIAFVAHRSGRSVDDALQLFDGRTYAACGYLGGWDAECDQLIGYCGSLGYEVGHAMRRWGRNHAFMYTVNHPRIHVLYDIARIYLEREGYAPRACDILPPDNLARSSVFAVYPEIGEELGVPGTYLFKRADEYTQIGLETFVAESFALFDRYAPGALVADPLWSKTFARVSAVLDAGRAAA